MHNTVMQQALALQCMQEGPALSPQCSCEDMACMLAAIRRGCVQPTTTLHILQAGLLPCAQLAALSLHSLLVSSLAH